MADMVAVVEVEDAEEDAEEIRTMTTSHRTHIRGITRTSNHRKVIRMAMANTHSHRKAGNHLHLAREALREALLHRLLDTTTRMLPATRASSHMAIMGRITRHRPIIRSRMVIGAAMEMVDHHHLETTGIDLLKFATGGIEGAFDVD